MFAGVNIGVTGASEYIEINFLIFTFTTNGGTVGAEEIDWQSFSGKCEEDLSLNVFTMNKFSL